MSLLDLQQEGHKTKMVITAKEVGRKVIGALTILSSNDDNNKLIFAWNTGAGTSTYTSYAFTFDKNDVKKVVPKKQPLYKDSRHEYQITGLETIKKGYDEPPLWKRKRVKKHFKIFRAHNDRDRFTEINELITGGKQIPTINNLTDGYEVIVKDLVVHKKKDIRRGYSKHSITILLNKKEKNGVRHEVRFCWEKKDHLGENNKRVFTFFKDDVERRDEDSDVGPNEVEYKILGKIRWMKNTDNNPNRPKKEEMKKRISFKFLKDDNPNYELANIHNFLKFNHVETLNAKNPEDLKPKHDGSYTSLGSDDSYEKVGDSEAVALGGGRKKSRKQRKSRRVGRKIRRRVNKKTRRKASKKSKRRGRKSRKNKK